MIHARDASISPVIGNRGNLRDVSADEANVLCTQCGLCCDGTFYGSVVVAEGEGGEGLGGEVPRLERIGLRIVRDDAGTPAMPQPCSALRDRLCAVYSDRPKACGDYQCLLRKKLAASECTFVDAVADVKRMRELLATIRVAFECPDTMSIWERILAMEEPTTPEAALEASRKYAAGIAAVGELLAVGRASFEPRFAGGGAR